MIGNNDLRKDLKELEKINSNSTDKEVLLGILKSNILAVKLLHNVRTNQAISMNANDIPLVATGKTNEK